MRRIVVGLLGLAALLLVLPLLLAALALQAAPLVPPPPPVAVDDLQRAHQALKAQDPRRAADPQRVRRVVLTERDANLLLDRLADRWLPSQVQLQLLPGQARLQLSMAVAAGPLGTRWLNVEAELREWAGRPSVESLWLGRLPVPGRLADALLWQFAQRQQAERADARLAADLLRGVRFGRERLVVDYEWRADTAQRLAAALLGGGDRARLRAYHDRLFELTQAAAGTPRVPLPQLLQPLFALAAQRSAAGADPAQENRAAVLVLALYVNGRTLGALLPDVRDWPRPRWRQVTLAGRDDFPQHYLVSAALALEGGGPFADAMGVYKEVLDSRGGSGFSFNDIAADRAGRRFGERAQHEAAALQAALSRGPVAEADLMPDARDLPEFLPEPEFVRRYGGLGGPGYQRMLAEIERRVAATPLLR